MTAQDPLHVFFRLPDERLARHLDRMIHDAGGDPDRWLADIIEADQDRCRAEVQARLAALAEKVSAHIDRDAVAAWDGKAPPIDGEVRRPRRPRPSSDWRTR
ncbi:hypothetical protein [Nocardia farcinica]|uniref:hypothetical protein n=1 Tax=Nocardia farcinica TaxID=37329 RepID=UPI0024550939|nr:hypothetical protein [Nocardia farcinica]